MSKGNQLPDMTMLRTKIPDIDQFFSRASDPLKSIVDWNNNLDSMLGVFRSMGSDIKKAHMKTPQPVIGVSEVKLSSDALSVSVVVMKDNKEVPAKNLDKITKQYVAMLETKAKLVNKRVLTLKKKPNLDHVKLKLEESEVQIDIDKKWGEEYADDDALIDLKRSVCKFNDRYALLAEQLKGPVTVKETVVALFEDVKAKIKELGSEIKVKIGSDLIPEIEGIPKNLQEALPSLPARGWQLYNDLIAYLKELSSEVPGMESKLSALASEAKQMQSTIKDSATSAGLSMSDGFKALKAFKKNMDLLLSAPKIVTQLLKTIRETLLSIGGAFTGKADSAAPAAIESPKDGAASSSNDGDDGATKE